MNTSTLFIFVSTLLSISCSSEPDKKRLTGVQNESVELSVAVKDGPCSGPEYSQMDFWIGNWELRTLSPDTSQESGFREGKATNTVRKILDGCVIEENFEGPDLSGKSYSTYSKGRGGWYQTWVDNSGSYMPFIGVFEDSRKIFRMEVERNGRKILFQMVFYKIEENSFTWDWERSVDGGETWKLLWRIEYARRI